MFSIKKTGKDYSLRFPAGVARAEYVERFLNYLRLAEISSKNKMNQEVTFELSESFKSQWWEENREKFLSRIKK